MYQKERIEKILRILQCNGYVTVKQLTEELRYSPATIHRDLNMLAQAGKIKRTYGGVEVKEETTVPVMSRYEQAKPAKKRIAKRAAELIANGDTVFMDGSTTVQYMGEYLLEKRDLTVLTNNTALSSLLSEYGITVIVLGGRVVEAPYMLGGAEAVEAASHYRADKCFFSTAFVSPMGEMSYTGDVFFSLHRTMLRNSKESVYLVDGDKVDPSGGKVILGDLSLASTVISDHDFGKVLKENFPHTRQILV